MQGQNFIFFGVAGSGKGTQAKILMDYLKNKNGTDTVYAYPGDEYRKLIASGNYTSKLVKASYDKGELQPDFLTNVLFANILVSTLTPEKNIMADGYPRTLVQSQTLEMMLKFFKRDNIKIIYIDIGEEEAIKRNLLRGRTDDTKEGMAKRLKEYRGNVVGAMEYFKGKNGYELFSINGEQSVEDVHKDIIKALGL